MQELTPVGLSKDEKCLVLVSSRGVEFSVALDQKLRDALRGDQNRLGQLEMKMESTLRPKDIQSRIRSGESAEEVAAAAGSSIDKIMVYAGPVLAERAHVAESAQLASIRRKNADASVSARTLSEAAPPWLREVGVRPDDVEWDAWRRDDGRWTVVATFESQGAPQRAEFTYDMPGRYVVADNEPARHLTGEGRAAEPPAATAPGSRRLTAVPNQDELPLGDDLGADAIALVSEDDSLTADHADADWMGRGAEPEPAADSGADSDVDSGAVSGVGSDDHELTAEIGLDEPAPTAGTPAADEHHASDDAEDPEAHTDPEPRPKKRGRAQVPSWDEIMFGSGGKAD